MDDAVHRSICEIPALVFRIKIKNKNNCFLQFTTYRFYQTVEPGKEVTFEYRFVPSEALSSRPFGLVINVNYKDSGLSYLDAVFNSTINVVEPDEGFDGET